MDIKRKSYNQLLEWKKSTDRKSLLIRGARQVGKTTLVRQFSKEFDRFIELNLEKEEDRRLFEIDDINQLLNAILLLKNVTDDGQSLLLFIDEIQESPKAIQQLRYFNEEKHEIFVIAAGSLLEFALKDIPNFPVGRIEYLYLQPLNFEEYLGAIGQAGSIEILNSIPVVEYSHEILLKKFNEYAIVGGMPEAVDQFRNNRNFTILPKIYNRLWQAYKDDIEKYARNNTERKVIRHVMDGAPYEKDRITMEGFGKSNYKSREVGEALRALDLARIIRLIYPTTSLSPPLDLDKRKRPRLQFLDTGLLGSVQNIHGQMIGVSDMSDFQRGRIIQHLVNQELMSLYEDIDYKPPFWVREEKGGSSEIDLVYQARNLVIPIEVKSGKQGKLRSLHQFVERSEHPYAIRMYAGKFNVEQHNTPGGKPYLLMNLPYYLGTKIPQYVEHFIDEYQLKV